MPAARGDHVHPYAPIEQYRLVTAAEIMEPQLGEAELAGQRIRCGGQSGAVPKSLH